MVSHEFKTPLAVINSAVQAIEVFGAEEISDKIKVFLGKIKQNSLRQLRFVNNLLDITRLKAGRLKIEKRNIDIIFITRVIVESVRLFSVQKGVAVSFKTSLKQFIVRLDEEKYERILLKLLSNAIKFTPSGKNIKVELALEKDKICIEVKDEGSIFKVLLPMEDVQENTEERKIQDSIDNRIVQSATIEFSDIYFC